MYELTYENRPKELNLYSIQRTRDRYQIIFVVQELSSRKKVTNFNPPIVINSSGRSVKKEDLLKNSQVDYVYKSCYSRPHRIYDTQQL